MKKELFFIFCLICTHSGFSQVYQLITLKSGSTLTVEFISLKHDNLNCNVFHNYSDWRETSIPRDSIYSVRTLDVNYDYDEFDEFLSNGKKMYRYEKIADYSTQTNNLSLYVSARLIQKQTILVCKMKIKKQVLVNVPVLDIKAMGNIDFLFENGQTLTRPIENSYLILGTTKASNSYEFAYVILKEEDRLLFVNNNLHQITIDKFTFVVEMPEIIKRMVLAMNDEEFF